MWITINKHTYLWDSLRGGGVGLAISHNFGIDLFETGWFRWLEADVENFPLIGSGGGRSFLILSSVDFVLFKLSMICPEL